MTIKCIFRLKLDDADDDVMADETNEEEKAPVFVHWADTVTVSSVEGYQFEVEATEPVEQDHGTGSDKGSKQMSVDVERLPSEERLERGASSNLQQQESRAIVADQAKSRPIVDDQAIADAVISQDKLSERLDDSASPEPEERVSLPDYVCPNSARKSKEVHVKQWLSRSNTVYAKKSLPLL